MYVCQYKKKSHFLNTPRLLKGFTLIELLIVIVTMFLVFTAGYANLRGYQRRKRLDAATVKVKSALRLAQEMALSGKKPPDAACINLNSIRFRSAGPSYIIRAECFDSTGDLFLADYNPEIRFNFLNSEFTGVTFPTTSVVAFQSLGRGVINATPPIVITLILAGEDNRTITVTSGGEIN